VAAVLVVARVAGTAAATPEREAAVGAAVFVVLGVVGLRGRAWVVPAGFLLHGVWDWAHHAMERRTVGRWWPPFCALFDVIFGVYLMVWG
jgi:hypothetical protein